MAVTDPIALDGRRVQVAAQDVMAALSIDLLEGSNPDAFLLRDSLGGQVYVSAALYAILKRLVIEVATMRDISVQECLQGLGLRVAAQNPQSPRRS